MMEKQTIVVKVGTSSLTLSDGTMDAEKIRNITTQLAALQTAGHHVILVSSGAIAAPAEAPISIPLWFEDAPEVGETLVP